jgi:hypothetical protein
MSWEFTDTAVASGDFTGVAGNIVSISIQSDVGDGYTNSLSDLVLSDQANIRVVFNAARDLVIELEDVDPGFQILYFNGTEGETGINDGTNYYVSGRQDNIPVSVMNNDDIFGRLVRRAVPEPSIIALIGIGLAGTGFARRRGQRS